MTLDVHAQRAPLGTKYTHTHTHIHMGRGRILGLPEDKTKQNKTKNNED
jgi:hypothetical protein